MSITRRNFLVILGGGTIVAATGLGGFIATRTPHKALEPWSKAGGYDEPRRRALSYAILAPNPHNRQPWLVDLSRDNEITLFVDTNKMLPHTDPFNRQITIGLGCFLELLVMAAAQDGYLAKVKGFPAGFDEAKLDKRPVAVISFVKDRAVKKDPLFAHVLERRSLKVPFDMERKVSGEVLNEAMAVVRNGSMAGATNKADSIEKLRRLTHAANKIENETPRTYRESVDLYRIGKAEINANPDGITIGGPLMDTLAALGMLSREQALNMNSASYKQALDVTMALIDSAMGYIWLTTKTNTRIDQLNCGRDWLRINMATTGLGVGLHPISQALQEYREMKVHFEQLPKELGEEGQTVQMLGRLGYAEKTGPSPRWPIEAKVLKV